MGCSRTNGGSGECDHLVGDTLRDEYDSRFFSDDMFATDSEKLTSIARTLVVREKWKMVPDSWRQMASTRTPFRLEEKVSIDPVSSAVNDDEDWADEVSATRISSKLYDTHFELSKTIEPSDFRETDRHIF